MSVARRLALLLALAPAAGAQASIFWTFGEDFSTADDRLGQSVALLHDAAGPGQHGTVAGAPGDTDGQFTGAVWVLRGDGSASVVRNHHGALGSELGYAVAAVGDVNGDGREDYAAGEPGSDGGFTNGGGFIVWSGATGNFLYERFGPKAGARLGEVLAGVGDANGDGFDDFLAGAPSWDGPLGALDPDRGYAALYNGKNGAILKSWTGANDGDRLGTALAQLPDLTGDDVAEFAIGVPGLEVGSPFSILNAGSCQVFNGTTQNLLVTVNGSAGNEELGSSVCAVGDSDADNKLEFAVGGPGFDDGDGRVTVYESKAANVVTTLEGIDLGTSDRYGSTIGPAGDVDKDGRDDLIVLGHNLASTASSYGHVHLGKDWSVYGVWVIGLPGGDFGTSLASGWDISGDGWPDAVMGLPGYELHDDAGLVRGYDFIYHAGGMGIPGYGDVTLDMYGTQLHTGGQMDLLITGAEHNKPLFLMASPQQEVVSFKGGTLVPDASLALVFALQTDANGEFYMPGIPGGGAPPNGVITVFVQGLVKDNFAPKGWWLTNPIFVQFFD